jgi:ABC-type multidrug transport system ATPase subunit
VSKGISGGERKRLAIGVELLANPSVIMLDEPTTGLDAKVAHSVMATVRRIAVQQGKTVICTIHQPRSSIYYLFDHLMVLGGGKTLYFGPAGDAALARFTELGYPLPALPASASSDGDQPAQGQIVGINPADHVIDVASMEPIYGDDGESKRRQKLEEERIAALV